VREKGSKRENASSKNVSPKISSYKSSSKNHYLLKDTQEVPPESVVSHESQEILKLQKQMGNRWTAGMLEHQEQKQELKQEQEKQEQEDKKLIQHLSLPIKEKYTAEKKEPKIEDHQKNQKENVAQPWFSRPLNRSAQPLKQFPPRHGAVKREEYPLKLGELTLPTGVTHLGSGSINKRSKSRDSSSQNTEKDNKRKLRTVLVTEERREDHQKKPIRNEEKKVYRSNSQTKRSGSQVQYAHDWQNGAVAITDDLDKSTGKLLRTTKKQITKSPKSGNIKKVLPCLDQEKETKEKEQLQLTRSKLNLSDQASRHSRHYQEKTKIDRTIDRKNRIVAKKKNKESELSKKIDTGLKHIKAAKSKLSDDDFFGLLWQKRRKKTEEEQEAEEQEQNIWQEELFHKKEEEQQDER